MTISSTSWECSSTVDLSSRNRRSCSSQGIETPHRGAYLCEVARVSLVRDYLTFCRAIPKRLPRRSSVWWRQSSTDDSTARQKLVPPQNRRSQTTAFRG